jgi:YbbR domain-containing protein
MVSERTSRWRLRLVALLIAVVAWVSVTLENRGRRLAEKQIDANVTYNTRRGLAILQPVERVSVRLRGRTQQIRNLNPLVVDVLVDLSEAEPGAVEVQLGPQNVFMPEGLEVLSIDPNVVRLTLDRQVSRLVRVNARLTGAPAGNATIAGPVEVIPDRVLVSGPESRLSRLAALPTNPVSLDGHTADFAESAAVISPDPLVQIGQPSVVTVRVPLRVPNADGDGAGTDGGEEADGGERPGPARGRGARRPGG